MHSDIDQPLTTLGLDYSVAAVLALLIGK